MATTMTPDERNDAGTGGGVTLRDAFWNGLKMESDQSLHSSSQSSLGSAVQTPPKGAKGSNKKSTGRKNAGGILKEGGERSTTSASTENEAPTALPQGHQQKQQLSRPTVMFAPSVKVKLTTGLWEYTDHEFDAVWTTDDDRRRNQVDIIETVQWMRENAQANQKDTDTLSSRGLEHMRTPLSYEQKKINREKVLRAVFAEQERQWIEELHNSRDLAAASGTHSELAKKTAILHAITDEQYVAARRRSSHLKVLHSWEGGRGRSASADWGKGRRRRSSRLSFEKHGDKVLDEIILVAEQCDREDPVGRRRSVESEGDESGADADENAANVPVISRIEKEIIHTEVMAGRMVRYDGSADLLHLSNESKNSFSLDEFQASGDSVSLDESKGTVDGDWHPPASAGSRRESFSFVRMSASKDLTGLAPGGDCTMATILDDYYSSDGSACGSDDARSMSDDAPLLQTGQEGSSGNTSSKRAKDGVLGIPIDGKETFMSAFRKSKRRERSRERSKGPVSS